MLHALFVVVSAGTGIPADQLGAPHQWVPAEQCTFANPPLVPYYWDPACHNDLTSLGCWADGVHAECRFCGEAPYTGVHCPKESIVPKKDACRFDEAPATPFRCQEFSVLFCKTFFSSLFLMVESVTRLWITRFTRCSGDRIPTVRFVRDRIQHS